MTKLTAVVFCDNLSMRIYEICKNGENLKPAKLTGFMAHVSATLCTGQRLYGIRRM